MKLKRLVPGVALSLGLAGELCAAQEITVAADLQLAT